MFFRFVIISTFTKLPLENKLDIFITVITHDSKSEEGNISFWDEGHSIPRMTAQIVVVSQVKLLKSDPHFWVSHSSRFYVSEREYLIIFSLQTPKGKIIRLINSFSKS